MKAVRYYITGGPEVLKIDELPVPEPGPGQVLIKSFAVGVNGGDSGRRSGIYNHPGAKLPSGLGMECAGLVEAIGAEVTGVTPGQRVFAYGVPNAYAEYAVSSSHAVHPLPEDLSFETGASIGITFMTSWHGLVTQAKCKQGESILIQGAGGGCGVTAIQIAKHLGMRVLATASSDEKLKKAAAIGADDLINYANTDFVEEVRRLTANRGVDVVYDGVGGETFLRSMDCLASGGRLVTYGQSGGPAAPQIDLMAFWGRNISVMGVAVTSLSREPVEHVVQLIRNGTLKHVIDRSFPLEEAAEAHGYLDSRKAFGKLVLTVQP